MSALAVVTGSDRSNIPVFSPSKTCADANSQQATECSEEAICNGSLILPARSSSPLEQFAQTSLKIGALLAVRHVDSVRVSAELKERQCALDGLSETQVAFKKHMQIGNSLERQGSLDVIQADRIAVDIGIALRGIFVDAYRVISLLRDLPPHMIQLTNDCFSERHGVSIEMAVTKNLPPSCGWFRTIGYSDLKRETICHFACGRSVEGHASELALLLTKKAPTELAEFFLRHRSASPEIVRTFCLQQRERFPVTESALKDSSVPAAFAKMAALCFSGDSLTFVTELSQGRLDTAFASLLHGELTRRSWTSKAYRSAQIMLLAPEEVRPYITDAYRRMYTSCPEIELSKLKRNTDLQPLVDISLAALRGDSTGVRASSLAASLLKIVDDWHGAVFVGNSRDENRITILRYEEQYARSFWKDLRKAEGSAIGLHLMVRLIQNGSLDRAEVLRDSIRGFGAYAKGVVDSLAGLSPGQVHKLEDEYRQLSVHRYSEAILTRPLTVARKLIDGFGQVLRRKTTLGNVVSRKNLGVETLEEELESELSGDYQVDALMNLTGSLPTPQSYYARLEAQYSHERSRRLQRLVNFLNVDAAMIDGDFKALSDYYYSHINALPTHSTTTNGTAFATQPWSLSHLQRFTALARFVENSLESVRRTRQFAANFVATQAASIVGAATFIGAPIFLTTSLPATIVLTGVTSIVARAVVKYLFSGSGYGRVEMVQDSLFSAAAGLGRSSNHMLSAFRFTRTLASGSETRALGYALSWIINKVASIGESFGLNRKPMYLEHVEREARKIHSEYTFSLRDYMKRLR